MKRVLASIAVLTLCAPAPAQAAWAICTAELFGASITAKTELEAKQKALADWVAQAGAQGIAFTRWQLAWDRRLTCEPTGDGNTRCIARGRPCRISHVPPPADSEILKPGQARP